MAPDSRPSFRSRPLVPGHCPSQSAAAGDAPHRTPGPAALGPQVGRVLALSVDGAECPMAAGGMPQHRRVGAGWPAWSRAGELGVTTGRAAEPGTVLKARASWPRRVAPRTAPGAPSGRWGISDSRPRARPCARIMMLRSGTAEVPAASVGLVSKLNKVTGQDLNPGICVTLIRAFKFA